MKCVEFETRLNDLLDERVAPVAPNVDGRLLDHAQNCARCSDLLSAHEALLEGVAAMPAARLSEVERLTIAHRIVAEVGSAPLASFQSEGYSDHARPASDQHAGCSVELDADRAPLVAPNRTAPLAIIGLVLATAAALLIALLPWFRGNHEPVAPAGQGQHIADFPVQPRSCGTTTVWP
jgi:hypothetical protein